MQSGSTGGWSRGRGRPPRETGASAAATAPLATPADTSQERLGDVHVRTYSVDILHTVDTYISVPLPIYCIYVVGKPPHVLCAISSSPGECAPGQRSPVQPSALALHNTTL